MGLFLNHDTSGKKYKMLHHNELRSRTRMANRLR